MLTLTDDFGGLVNTDGEEAKAVGYYIGADSGRGGEGHFMTFFLQGLSKWNQWVPVPRASLAGKEYLQDVSLPILIIGAIANTLYAKAWFGAW